MPDANDPSKIEDMSFETALQELEGIVEALEQGDVPLDKSIEYYERGEALQNHCNYWSLWHKRTHHARDCRGDAL